MKKSLRSSLGSSLMVVSMLFAGYRFMDVWTAQQAGLGDINYSIAHYAFAIMWFLLGVALKIQSYFEGEK